jgi:hypothetical protein
MALSSEYADILRQSGFTEYEINELSNARTPSGYSQTLINLNEPAWRKAIESRIDLVTRLRAQGMQDDQISQRINGYYKRRNNSPWDFLKVEYYKVRARPSYMDLARVRAEDKLQNAGLR